MTAQAIAKHVEPPTALTPMDLIDRATAANASPEMLEKLMGLQERYEANEARKAFDTAIAEAKADIPPIVRNATGHNSKKYVDFAAIARVVDPILSRHGLSYRFRSEQGERINVTCILSHRAGHSEQTTLSGPADTTGNKNAVQAIGSTLTYLQRYSLIQALGLAAAHDDDGQGAGIGPAISAAQLDQLIAECDSVKADKEAFCSYLKIDALADLPASRFQQAMDALAAKRKKAS